MAGYSNIGVLQTTVAELVSVKEHQRAASVPHRSANMLTVDSASLFCDAIRVVSWVRPNPPRYTSMDLTQHSSIIGPALGGALAQPCVSYPDLFPRGTIFDRYPFLLPNLVCFVVLVCGVAIGILFLEETHEDLKHRHDYGLELGKALVRRITGTERENWVEVPLDKAGDVYFEEDESLIEDDDPPPGYRTSEGSPHCPSSRTASPVTHKRSRKTRAAKKAFTKQVVMIIVGYGILAL